MTGAPPNRGKLNGGCRAGMPATGVGIGRDRVVPSARATEDHLARQLALAHFGER
jgi:hypothetical protein